MGAAEDGCYEVLLAQDDCCARGEHSVPKAVGEDRVAFLPMVTTCLPLVSGCENDGWSCSRVTLACRVPAMAPTPVLDGWACF